MFVVKCYYCTAVNITTKHIYAATFFALFSPLFVQLSGNEGKQLEKIAIMDYNTAGTKAISVN